MAETLLKIENLTKEYEGQKILDGIDLEVKQGDVLVVVGPSGCGKSTLLRCINALEPIQGGTIKLQGMDIRKGSKNITTLRQKIGMVFQSYELFPHLTVLDNIRYRSVTKRKPARRPWSFWNVWDWQIRRKAIPDSCRADRNSVLPS